MRYVAVDDVGRAVNPMIVHGQTMGAVVQGLGQALFEHCVYDRGSGQLLSGSLMDYSLPRADDLPDIETWLDDTPTQNQCARRQGRRRGRDRRRTLRRDQRGARCAGAAGGHHIDMPATPARVWEAIQDASRQ